MPKYNFVNINDREFQLNGIPYNKVFIALPMGETGIRIVGIYESRTQLVPPTSIEKVTVNNNTYGTVSALISAIKEIIYTDYYDEIQAQIAGLASGYQGPIEIADTPAEDGIYTPTEAGTYTSAGNLVYAPEGADEGKQVQFIKTGSNWVKNSIEAGLFEEAVDEKIKNSESEVYKTLIEQVVYKNSNGDTEYDGSTIYGNKGVGIFKVLKNDFYFNSIKTKVYSPYSGEVEVRVYKGDSSPSGTYQLSDFNLIESIEYPSGVFNSVSTNFQHIKLTEYHSFKKDDVLIIVVRNKENGIIGIRQWQSQAEPLRTPIMISSANYTANWEGNWFLGSTPGYLSTDVILYFDQKKIIDEVINEREDILFEEAGTKNVVKDAETLLVKNIRIDENAFYLKPSNYIGNSAYPNGTGLGIFQKLNDGGFVKTIKAKLYGSANFSGTAKVYKSSVYNLNMNNNELVEQIPIAEGTFNQTSSFFAEIMLTEEELFKPGEFIYVLIEVATGTINIRFWSGSYPEYGRFLIKSGSNWNATSGSYYSTPLWLIAENQQEASNTVSPPRLVLPDTIYATVGYTRQLFFRNIIESINPYQWNIKVTGNVGGKQYPRYYEFIPTSVGTNTFTVSIYNDNDELIASKNCTVKTNAVLSNPASTKHIWSVGDSILASGSITTELGRMIKETGGSPAGLNLSNFQFEGTQGSGSYTYEAYAGKNWNWFINQTTNSNVLFTVASHDKTPDDIYSIFEDGNNAQWKLEEIVSATQLNFSRVNHNDSPPSSGTLTYISGGTNTQDIVYSSISGGALNPFWNENTGALDFQNYATENGFQTPDLCISLLTWNGIAAYDGTPESYEVFLTDVRTFLDQFHSDFPDAKFGIIGMNPPSINGGVAANYGDANSPYGNVFDLVKKINGMNIAYQNLVKESAYNSWVKFAQASIEFDNENNMLQIDSPVNLRNSTTEKLGSNGVHPAQSGYLQLADTHFNLINEFL